MLQLTVQKDKDLSTPFFISCNGVSLLGEEGGSAKKCIKVVWELLPLLKGAEIKISYDIKLIGIMF